VGVFETYVNLIYLSSCTMAAVMFGDMNPLGHGEQYIDVLCVWTGRMFLAFLFTESAYYLSRQSQAQTTHTNRLQRIKKWMVQNQLPIEMRNRVVVFYEMQWKNFKGQNQETIISDLPVTLIEDVQKHMYKKIVDNWNVMLAIDDKGLLDSII